MNSGWSAHGNDAQGGQILGGVFLVGVEVGEGLDGAYDSSKIAWPWRTWDQTWSIPGRRRGDVESRCNAPVENAYRLGFYDLIVFRKEDKLSPATWR